MRCRACSLAVAAALAAAPPARAGEGDPLGPGLAPGDLDGDGLDESLLLDAVPSVTGASRYDQRTTDAPAAVTVVTAQDIARHGWRTLDEVLASVRSFQRSDDRTYPSLGARGLAIPGDYGGRVLLLVDGVRMNDVIYDGLPLGHMLPIPLAVIERIEVIRGATSALYGSNALLAVINVVTRRGRDLQGIGATVEGGSRGDWDAVIAGGHRATSGLELLVAGEGFLGASRTYDLGAIADPSDVSDHVVGADGERAVSLHARASYHEWGLSASFNRRDKTIPTGDWETVLGATDTYQHDQNFVLTGEYADHLASGLDVSARATYHHYDYGGHFHFREPVEDADTYVDTYQGDSAASDVVRLEARGNLFVAPELRLALGTELDLFLRIEQQTKVWERGAASTSIMDQRASRGTVAADAQVEWTPTAAFTANLAARADWSETLGAMVSPRLALLLKPSPTGVFKALAGAAFRAPNAFETEYADGTTMIRPTALGPERIANYEMVWEQIFCGALRTVLDGFLYHLEDVVTLATDAESGLLVYTNSGSMSAVGVEAEVDLDLDSVTLSASGSYQRAVEGDARLPSSPLWLGKLRLAVPILGERLGAGLDVSYASPRLTLAGDETEPVVLVNLTLTSVDLVEGLSLRVAIDNLLDYRWSDPASGDQRLDAVPQEGFGLRVRLGYRF